MQVLLPIQLRRGGGNAQFREHGRRLAELHRRPRGHHRRPRERDAELPSTIRKVN